jgi:hypothetical protein
MQYVCLSVLVVVCQADTGRQGFPFTSTSPFLSLLQLPLVPVEAAGGEAAGGEAAGGEATGSGVEVRSS